MAEELNNQHRESEEGGMDKPPQLKRGEKVLTLDDLRPYIQSSKLAISIRYVQSDIKTSTISPWVYKNKKNVWVHYSINRNNSEENK